MEEELPCLVSTRASEKRRQEAYLATVERHWTVRRACAAAGITRATALEWEQDPEFMERLNLARLGFCEAMEEAYIQTALGRGSRVQRASLSAMQGFLATYHPDYSRSRVDQLLREFGRASAGLLKTLQNCVKDPTVMNKVKAELQRMESLIEVSGGSQVR